jgi:hypothetical protein
VASSASLASIRDERAETSVEVARADDVGPAARWEVAHEHGGVLLSEYLGEPVVHVVAFDLAEAGRHVPANRAVATA